MLLLHARPLDVDTNHRCRWNPNLLAQLYDALGPPCTQCGRRFTADEKGRARKTAHMDWHFRVNQRIAEAEKRGQHRSFYVDETVSGVLSAPRIPL